MLTEFKKGFFLAEDVEEMMKSVEDEMDAEDSLRSPRSPAHGPDICWGCKIDSEVASFGLESVDSADQTHFPHTCGLEYSELTEAEQERRRGSSFLAPICSLDELEHDLLTGAEEKELDIGKVDRSNGWIMEEFL